MNPNSSPMIAKMKSFQAFGRYRPPASLLSPRPLPKIPPSPSASRPWIVWKPVAERVRPRVEERLDALELVAAQADEQDADDADRAHRAELPRGSHRRRRTS